MRVMTYVYLNLVLISDDVIDPQDWHVYPIFLFNVFRQVFDRGVKQTVSRQRVDFCRQLFFLVLVDRKPIDLGEEEI